MKTKQTVFRQGDVILRKIKTLPKNREAKPSEGGLVILAYGEVTGHHHSLPSSKVKHFTIPGTQATIIEVAEALAELSHQEHATINIPQGFYEVIQQREYHPQEVRRVQD